MIEFIAISISVLNTAALGYIIYRGSRVKPLAPQISAPVCDTKEIQNNLAQIKELKSQIQVLQTNRAKEILIAEVNRRSDMFSFTYCQCDDPDCHLGKCLRPVRYLITEKNSGKDIHFVVCGSCFSKLTSLGRVGSFEDLIPPKVASFRKIAYRNEIDSNVAAGR